MKFLLSLHCFQGLPCPRNCSQGESTAESAEEGEAAETDGEANLAETLLPMLLDGSREPYEIYR